MKNLSGLLLLLLLLVGCASPSALLVANNGTVMRCNATGWGWMGVPVAYSALNSCVNDFKRLGYVELSDAHIGIKTLPTDPFKIVEVSDPAKEAGVRIGDILVELDGKPLLQWVSLYEILSKKMAGDRVSIKVNRDGKVMDFSVVMVGV